MNFMLLCKTVTCKAVGISICRWHRLNTIKTYSHRQHCFSIWIVTAAVPFDLKTSALWRWKEKLSGLTHHRDLGEVADERVAKFFGLGMWGNGRWRGLNWDAFPYFAVHSTQLWWPKPLFSSQSAERLFRKHWLVDCLWKLFWPRVKGFCENISHQRSIFQTSGQFFLTTGKLCLA